MARVAAPDKAPPPRPRTDFGPKVQAHQRYVLASGRQVPGVTTILGVLAKPALVPWANKLGLQGIDTNKYTDEAAQIGSLAHYLVECHLLGLEPVLDDYTPAQLVRARASFDAFTAWAAQHTLEPILVEAQLVSERWHFGGTVDCLALLDGVPTLLDFKTSSGIWPEHRYQVGAYWRLLEEHGHPIAGARIIRIPRDEGQGLEEHVLTGRQVLHGWRVFEHCLAIYALQKEGRR